MKTDSTPAVGFMNYAGEPPKNYERYFVPTIGTAWATALLEVAGLSSGERVLDVACGTGVVTRRASELVGPEGNVAGLDVNPGMLAVARSASPTSIEWHESSAESIPCPDASFDVVTCSLGLQFVPDRSAAMREIHRVLAAGGRVAIATVGPTPVFEILAQALARHVKPEVAAFMRHVFSLHEHQELHDLAEGAGLRSVSVQSKPCASCFRRRASSCGSTCTAHRWPGRSGRSATTRVRRSSGTSRPPGKPSSMAMRSDDLML